MLQQFALFFVISRYLHALLKNIPENKGDAQRNKMMLLHWQKKKSEDLVQSYLTRIDVSVMKLCESMMCLFMPMKCLNAV